MTMEKFTRASTQYHELKARLDRGEITVSDLKESLKKLMIVDDQGRYWMIGGKSGRWYRHDGAQWVMDDPLPFSGEPGKVTDTAEASDEEEDFAAAVAADDDERHAEPVLTGEGFLSGEQSDPVSFHGIDAGDRQEAPMGSDDSLDLGHAFQENDSSAYEEEPSAISMSEDSDLPIVTIDPPRDAETRERAQSPGIAGSVDEVESWQREPTQPVAPQASAETETANCRVCDAPIPGDAEYCPACGANQNETTPPKSRAHRERGGTATTMQIRSIHPFSLLFLLGGLGLILGVILGASFGIFNIFGDLIYQFPRMLQETRGKIQGGLIFGVLGGLAGFLSFALAALIASGLYNILADLFGGLRIRVRH